MGPSKEYFLSFTLREPVPEGEVVFALVSLVTVADMALRRVTTPQDIAYLVTFLASDESQNITGQEIVIDGGWAV